MLAVKVGLPTTGAGVGVGVGAGSWDCRMVRREGASNPAYLKAVAMAGAVRTEGSIGSPAGICHRMAIAAGGIKGIMVQADPVGIQVRAGFRPTADFDPGHKILGCGYHRDGMAQVAFQADGLLLGIQVFPIVAAEAAGRIDMAKIIWMGGPIHFLIDEHRLVIYGLQFRDRRFNYSPCYCE